MMLPAYGGQESDCISAAFGDIPPEDNRTPLPTTPA
jgi:hypothetical protein